MPKSERVNCSKSALHKESKMPTGSAFIYVFGVVNLEFRILPSTLGPTETN